MLRIERAAGLKGSTIAWSLYPIFRALGANWTLTRVRGLVGDIFWTAVAPYLETRAIAAPDAEPLKERLHNMGYAYREFSGSLTGENLSSALEAAWEAVCESIDRGIPASGWHMMTARQDMRGFGAYEYSLITGYDLKREEYLIHHAIAGEYGVRFDALGQIDGRFWLCLYQPPRLADDLTLERISLLSAIRHARQQSHQTLGLKALDYWIECLQNSRIAQYAGAETAGALYESRQVAAAFLQEIIPTYPEKAATHLGAAVHAYEEEAQAYRMFLKIFPRYAEGGPGNHRDRDTCTKGIAALCSARTAQEKAIAALEAVFQTSS